MKTRNLCVMTLLVGAMTIAPQLKAQISREEVSARIRAHMPSSSGTSSQSAQQSNEEQGIESSGSSFTLLGAAYGPSDLWLDVPVVVSNQVLLTLHNTQSNLYAQLLTNTDLKIPNDWRYGPIIFATNDTTIFPPQPTFGRDRTFYRAVEGFPIVSIQAFQDAIEPTNAFSGQLGLFAVILSDSLTNDLTVFYKVSGSAENGGDYSNIIGTVTIPQNNTLEIINIAPIQDNLLEFEEFVTLTLILTNGYVVEPNIISNTASIRIFDNFDTNVFTVVANVPSPDGLDYSPTTHSLISSVNRLQPQPGEPFNFVQIFTNGITTNLFVTNWSGIHGLTDEIKLATVKTSASGFTAGDMYFGTGVNGIIGRLSADGAMSNLNAFELTVDHTNTDTLIRGSLYVDDSGSFGGDLIAVTGGGEFEGGGVWRVTSSGVPTLLTTISNTHLEGVITLTNDPVKWGPFAGKVISGGEAVTNEYGQIRPLVYAISTNGAVQSFDLGIAPEDFDIIKPNQDLYLLDENAEHLEKLSSTLLTNYWGDLLITQEGAFGVPPDRNFGGLFIVHWDNATTNFVVRSITHVNSLEHVTFAPINLPSQPQ